MALTICEDAWNDKRFWVKRLYTVDPVEALIQAGGNFVLNISASPFWIGKRELRRDMLASIARQHKVPVVLVNQVGGNDSLVFDGSSLVLNREGNVIAQGRSFEEDLIYFDSQTLTGEMHEQMAGDEASVYSALVLGTRDYMQKCGFQKAIVGSERWHRFRSDRGYRRRCCWSRRTSSASACRVHIHRRDPSTMLALWRRIWGSALNCSPSIPRMTPIARSCTMFLPARTKM